MIPQSAWKEARPGTCKLCGFARILTFAIRTNPAIPWKKATEGQFAFTKIKTIDLCSTCYLFFGEKLLKVKHDRANTTPT
jgi:hypothetical protein